MRRALVISLIALVLVAGGVVAYVYFAPEASTHVDEEAMPGVTVRSGSFRDGLPAHHASGTVQVVRTADGSYSLRVEDYEATAGPDVYFYLTPKVRADTTETVEGEGLLVLVPGGARDGQATLRGNFNVPLPTGFDPEKYSGLSVWCQRYNALFGDAPLS